MAQQEPSVIEELIEEAEELTPWAMTYADMMTLLLVFFVLLYTVFFFQTREFERQLAAIRVTVDEQGATMSMLDYARGARPASEQVVLEEITGLAAQRAAILIELENAAREQGWLQHLRSESQGRRLHLHIDGQVLFPTGSARLSDQGLVILYNLMEILERHPQYQANLREHSNDGAGPGTDFADNWQLSAARAGAIFHYLLEQGFAAERLTATGYGAKTTPSLENLTTDRRVEIVLEKQTD